MSSPQDRIGGQAYQSLPHSAANGGGRERRKGEEESAKMREIIFGILVSLPCKQHLHELAFLGTVQRRWQLWHETKRDI